METEKKKMMEEFCKKEQYSKALQVAEDYLEKQDCYDWDALYMKAFIYSIPIPEYTDYYASIGIITVALNQDRYDINRWLAAGEIFENCGVYGESERCYRKAREMDPINYTAIIGLAVNRRAPGTQITNTEVKNLLETAISSKPDEWNAYHHLAVLLRELGDKKQAMEMYESALVRLPDTENERMCPELEKQIKSLKEEMTDID